MCRLFGMSAVPRRVGATFWLLEAPDSLARQSRREPDGTGLGTFTADGAVRLDKQPLAAYRDREFAAAAVERRSTTFVAHVRYSSSSALNRRNTHPFVQHDRVFAHNGVLGDLPALEAELGDHCELVGGDTDSERFFALITKRVREHGGDVTAGITAAANWVADNLPLLSINVVLTTATGLWALRYPETHRLYWLRRGSGGPHGDHHLDAASRSGRVRARSGDLARQPAVVVASERMDEDPGWELLEPGELLRVDETLHATCTRVLERPPARPLSLADLDARAAASQTG